MKNFFKVLKLKIKDESSLYNNLQKTFKDEFSLNLSETDFNSLLKEKRIKYGNTEITHYNQQLKIGSTLFISVSKSQIRDWSLPVKVAVEISPSMIIHDENIFLIGNKPANFSSNATIDSTRDNFLASMTRYISGKHKNKYLALHHRIDFETSGLLLFCKKKSYNKYFTELFEKKLIKKTYVAAIQDENDNFKDCVVSNNLDRDSKDKMKMKSVKVAGKSAKTTFRKIVSYNGVTLIEASPETGRFHQIRVHLSELGFPIMGDSIYGNKNASRTLLHAYKLSFTHPETKELLEFTAPIPDDFPQELIKLVK